MAFFSKRSARAHWQAGDRARDARNWADARAAYGEALKFDPNRRGLWMQYGHAAKELGDFAEAEAAYRTALVLDPRVADTHLHLAHLLKRQGRWREAESHFAKLAQLDPKADVRAELDQARAHRGDVPGVSQETLDAALKQLGSRLKGTMPNQGHYGRRFADHEIAMLNIKNLGYALARALVDGLPPNRLSQPPAKVLPWKPCTQSDMESDWAAYWAAELKTPLRYHRKLWEFCYILQTLSQAGKLKPGMTGLGFGCGEEPMIGVLAKHGVRVLATDKPVESGATPLWPVAGNDLEAFRAGYAGICPAPELRANIDFRPVDMRAIPADFAGKFDFCWSACSLEHLGSIEQGLGFIEAAMATLKPGGIAVHTTELNVDDGETVDHWSTVLFQRNHMLDIAERLRRNGHKVGKIDFSPGDGFLDGFVDMPPWAAINAQGHSIGEPDAHLKLSLDGFVCTSFGLSATA